MRIATKSTLSVLAVYFALLGGLAVWLDFQLRSMSSTLMDGTARLIGSEIATAMSESALEQLLQADPETRQRLTQIITDLTARSEVVAAIAVVDENGHVVVSDDLEAGHQLALPAVIFQGQKRVQFLTAHAPFEGGKYHLFVPLVRDDTIVGYLRLSINSVRIAKLYRRAERQLVGAAVAGLGFVAVLGFLFHSQMSRRSAALTRALEGAMRGELLPAHPTHDEFADALDTARRVGKELTAAREQSSGAQRRFGALMKVMDIGVLLLTPDHALDFANGRARELFGYREPGELEARWDDIRRALIQALRAPQSSAGHVDVEIAKDDRPVRLRFELYRLDDDEHAGHLALVKDREMVDALENELRLAIQMRGFARFYMAFAHDLKAPLNAMVLNLELLKESLSNPAMAANEAQRQERQARCIGILQDELSRLDRHLRVILTHAAPPSEVRQDFDLRDVVHELATLVSPQAKQQRVTLDTAVPDAPLPFTGHRDRLKQAMLNIAINALESMPDGGHMGIELSQHDGQARIAIRDSGPGISPELLNDIYRMHFTTKEGGTGIGLYVARSVVESHGGQIKVESAVGTGTCFELDLPIATEVAAA